MYHKLELAVYLIKMANQETMWATVCTRIRMILSLRERILGALSGWIEC